MGEIKAALVPELDVDEGDIRFEVLDSLHGLRSRCSNAYHGDPIEFEESACGFQELRVVVDDQTAQAHMASIGRSVRQRITATRVLRRGGHEVVTRIPTVDRKTGPSVRVHRVPAHIGPCSGRCFSCDGAACIVTRTGLGASSPRGMLVVSLRLCCGRPT
jgi:hypothetical protein